MKEDFLQIDNHIKLAAFLGLSYSQLSKIIYKMNSSYKYDEFYIPKKGGGHRIIKSPCKKLKIIQRKLKDVLYEIYPTRPAVHGFAKDRSIVSNANKHIDKAYVFNIDLKDYFGSIHFGRVRNLFKSSPFKFNNTVATILAQIYCSDNSLPQGAPTSPIIANMISWKLDAQLQKLAKVTNSTYTRYADDITFSFTCSKRRLPEEVVIMRDDAAGPGHAITQIIEDNGFKINYDKVRIAGKTSRMEVTGLTVNEKTNVSRRYIRQISSMLYAWRKHEYEAAEKEFNDKYSVRHRASGHPKSFKYVLKGKLAFLKSVRGKRDKIYTKLAKQFNALVKEKDLKFAIYEQQTPEALAIASLWVLEAHNCDVHGSEVAGQLGTGFLLDGAGMVTCAHVVSEKHNNKLFDQIKAFKYNDITKEFDVHVKYIDHHRDLAICELKSKEGSMVPNSALSFAARFSESREPVVLLGFPSYRTGQEPYVVDAKVAATFAFHGFQFFEIDHPIRKGNSGGPVINKEGKLVGVAYEGTWESSKEIYGKNAVIAAAEIEKVMVDENKVY